MVGSATPGKVAMGCMRKHAKKEQVNRHCSSMDSESY